MKNLVIHPFDPTTDFLYGVYKHLDCHVIRSWVSKEYLNDSIRDAERVIILGHGLPQGLIGPSNELMITDRHAELLRGKKNNIYIWCNADAFVEKNKLSGFTTGMIISEMYEAKVFGINAALYDIADSNQRFARAVRTGIYKDSYEAVKSARLRYARCMTGDVQDNPVVDFNLKNMFSYTDGKQDYMSLLGLDQELIPEGEMV